MSRFVLLSLALLNGCASSELLPLVDADGALVGSFDPASASLTLDVDGASAETSTGERVALADGAAFLDDTLVPGDEVTVYDADGAELDALSVIEPDADLSERDASSRYAGCERVDDGT